MKKLVILFAFILGLITSLHAQTFSVKVSVPTRAAQIYNNTASVNNKYLNNGNCISLGGSIEFSKNNKVKVKIGNVQKENNFDLYSKPLSRKQLENEKKVLTEIK